MALGTAIRDWAAPSISPTGLTWDGAHLWHADIQTDLIYQLDVDGVILRSLNTGLVNPEGLAWDGQCLWVAIAGNVIYQIDIKSVNGTVVKSFAGPGTTPIGLTWDGAHLWIADLGTDRLYQIDTDGVLLRTLVPTRLDPRGLTWDGAHLWAGYAAFVQQLSVDGTLKREVFRPGYGLAWDGRALWYTDTGPDRIYQMMVN